MPPMISSFAFKQLLVAFSMFPFSTASSSFALSNSLSIFFWDETQESISSFPFFRILEIYPGPPSNETKNLSSNPLNLFSRFVLNFWIHSSAFISESLRISFSISEKIFSIIWWIAEFLGMRFSKSFLIISSYLDFISDWTLISSIIWLGVFSNNSSISFEI